MSGVQLIDATLRIMELECENATLFRRYREAENNVASLMEENAALREQVEHLIGMIEQLESDLARFGTLEAFEGKKEAQP